jgi:hypothetical protein
MTALDGFSRTIPGLRLVAGRSELAQFVASDTHDPVHRPPRLTCRSKPFPESVKCGADRAHRSHHKGIWERVLIFTGRVRYRCHECAERFLAINDGAFLGKQIRDLQYPEFPTGKTPQNSP